MFKNIRNIASLMKQAGQMTGRMQALNEKLKSERITGVSGAGMVTVEANGLGEVIKVQLDETLVEKRDREMLEDLIPAAVNNALVKAKKRHQEAMQEMAQDMNLPGLDEAMHQVTGEGGLPEEPK